jgi:hypothetical protein
MGIANVLILLRVLVLWQDDRVRKPRFRFESLCLNCSFVSQARYPFPLGRVLVKLSRNGLYDAPDLHQGYS